MCFGSEIAFEDQMQLLLCFPFLISEFVYKNLFAVFWCVINWDLRVSLDTPQALFNELRKKSHKFDRYQLLVVEI